MSDDPEKSNSWRSFSSISTIETEIKRKEPWFKQLYLTVQTLKNLTSWNLFRTFERQIYKK